MAELHDRLKAALSDRYAIERPIGQGGMADVFVGRDLKHDRQVAIKVMRPEVASAVNAERFRRETEVEASLSHPHILPLHDSGDADGLPYFVTPYVEGESLKERLRREGQLPVADAVRIARQVADALSHAHERGIVHRDIKPGNILLSGKHALVADFGICRAMESAGDEALTSSGILVGTPAYMSPEQADTDAHIDGRSDVYALGCVLYEMLIGEPPFSGSSAQVVVARHLQETVPSLRVARPGVPPEVEAVVLKALEKSPADRYATASDVVAALESIDTESVPAPTHVPWAWPLARRVAQARERWPLAFFGTVGALLIASAVMASWFVSASSSSSSRWLAGEGGLVPYASAAEDPRGSYVILPFGHALQKDVEKTVLLEAAARLTRKLRGWETIRVVPELVVTGFVFDQELPDPVFPSMNMGFELAQRENVGTLIAITASVVQDSAFVEATLLDVEDGQELFSIQEAGLLEQVDDLVAPVAQRVLQLRGEENVDPEVLRAESNYPLAHQDFQAGLDALYGWELTEAESYFSRAIELDSAFALPHHYLALAIYWQLTRDPERIVDRGHEIARLTQQAAALGRAHGLRPGMLEHVEAFRALWAGEYSTARDIANRIVARDSSDTEGWLLVGTVEWLDPLIVEDGTRPQQNLNSARFAFERARRLSPQHQLSYGHLFDIDRRVAQTALSGLCSVGFEPAVLPSRPPYVPPDAMRQVGFCPLREDTIVWISRDDFDSEMRARATATAEELKRQASDNLMHWSELYPDQPRPHEEWAGWLLWQRLFMDCRTDPDEASELALAALGHREVALALRADTTPEDLIRLAVLRLAVGDTEMAVAITDQALATRYVETAPGLPPAPLETANVYLATGRPSRALEIVGPVRAVTSWGVRDERDGSYIPSGSVEPSLGALNFLGNSGVSGVEVTKAARALDLVWSESQHTPRQRALLRDAAVRWQGLGPAIALNDSLLIEWYESWREADVELAPVWSGLYLAASDSARAAEWVEPSIAAMRTGRTRPVDHFLVGLLAQKAGLDSTAIEHFRRVETCPLFLDRVDSGWALRTLSFVYRARSLSAAGHQDEAQQAYHRALALWGEAEPALAALIDEARTFATSQE